MFCAQESGQLLREFPLKPTRCEPEIKGRIHQVDHLFFVIDPAGVGDAGLAGVERFLFMGKIVVVAHKILFSEPEYFICNFGFQSTHSFALPFFNPESLVCTHNTFLLQSSSSKIFVAYDD